MPTTYNTELQSNNDKLETILEIFNSLPEAQNYGPAGTDLGLVKSGGDVAIADGVITVNDNSHNHNASNITAGTLAVARGGTGQTSLADTTYTTARYRGSALYATETTPTVNGVINWTYE